MISNPLAYFVGTDEPITQTCIEPGCEKPVKSRERCVNHYRAFRKANPDEINRYSRLKDPIAKLSESTVINHRGCWVLTRSLDTHGYGRLWFEGKSWQSHRFAYLRLGQPFPEEFDLDHLCNNPPCWNPTHIEPVPDRINLARGTGMIGAWAHLHATCVCCNRWAESCPDHGQLHWRPDWRMCLTALYPEVTNAG